MVTEPIRPLESVIQTLDTVEIIAGLYNVVEALVFLHERVCFIFTLYVSGFQITIFRK